MTLFIATVAALVCGAIAGGGEWSYEDKANWANSFPDCGLSKQSPIDISTSQVLSSLDAFTIAGSGSLSFTLINNGHSAQINVAGDVSVTGGGLPEEYKLAQCHFHWGTDSTKGSEHTINGNRYPLEMHCVTYKASLGSLGAAATEREGLAVLGFMFEEDDDTNLLFLPITAGLTLVTSPGGSGLSITIPDINAVIDTEDEYWRYSGSLTTPGCFESVIWTVFQTPLKIGTAQLEMFRTLKDSSGHDLVDNFRDPQPLNGRTVYSSS